MVLKFTNALPQQKEQQNVNFGDTLSCWHNNSINTRVLIQCRNRATVIVYYTVATMNKGCSRINEGHNINVTNQQLCHYGNLAVRKAM